MADNFLDYSSETYRAEIAAQRIVMAALGSGSLRFAYDISDDEQAANAGRFLGLITTTLAKTLRESSEA
ncbi:hypothetical protein [uncultured Azohydromonas sp.]|jgi:hypothetical protein|uniref:hypothetical protein n=1 Tax=uncultured Azohydromonas sp. TaxID=487342 RepID=UPI00262D4E00|nr:hypothetical protein [uncultured Azohydromonas sp.]